MKRMGKWLAASLVPAILFATACSKPEESKEQGKPAAEETVVNGKMKEPVMMTIAKQVDPQDKSLPEGETIDNNLFTRHLTEKTNVSFKATLTGATGGAFAQKLQVAIASNDIPDVMSVNQIQLKQLVESDMIEDLTAVYEKYADPKYRDIYKSGGDRALKNATFNGKLMAIPGSNFEKDSVLLLWVRQDWLNKLNLPVPKTLDDVEKVAKAFIEQDPDGNGKADTIGLTGNANLYGTNGFDSIFSAFHAYPNIWVKDASGKVIHGSVAPETKKGLEKLRDWYAKGLIDKEFALRKNTNELLAGGKAGLFFGPWWSPWGGPIGDAVKINPQADWQAYAVPLDEQGKFNGLMADISPQYIVLKKGFKHPEALMLVLNESIQPAFIKLSSSVNPTYVPVRLSVGKPDGVTYLTSKFKAYFEGNTDTSSYDEDELQKLEMMKKYKANPVADLSVWQPMHSYWIGAGALLNPMNEVRNLLYNSTKTMETKWTSIKKVQVETFLKIIMGNLPLDAFEEYKDQFNKLGGDVITQEVEQAIKK